MTESIAGDDSCPQVVTLCRRWSADSHLTRENLKLALPSEEEIAALQDAASSDGSYYPVMENDSPLLSPDAEKNSSENVTDEEIERRFQHLTLAIQADRYTLERRLELHHRQKELAETNLVLELEALKESSQGNSSLLQPEYAQQVHEHADTLQQTFSRLSSTAISLGAVIQEERLSKAFDVMVQYVDGVKKSYDRLQKELAESKQLIKEHNIGIESSVPLRPQRPGSLVLGSSKGAMNVGYRRRASLAAIPQSCASRGELTRGMTPSPLVRRISLLSCRNAKSLFGKERDSPEFPEILSPFEPAPNADVIHESCEPDPLRLEDANNNSKPGPEGEEISSDLDRSRCLEDAEAPDSPTLTEFPDSNDESPLRCRLHCYNPSDDSELLPWKTPMRQRSRSKILDGKVGIRVTFPSWYPLPSLSQKPLLTWVRYIAAAVLVLLALLCLLFNCILSQQPAAPRTEWLPLNAAASSRTV